MASKVTTVLIDDIDGSDADETVSFRIDGTGYEIDLSSENAAGLREALAPYIAAGRKAARRSKPPTRRKRQGKSQSPSSPDIREWAQLNGHKTSSHGKIPSRIPAAHEKAWPKASPDSVTESSRGKRAIRGAAAAPLMNAVGEGVASIRTAEPPEPGKYEQGL